MFMDTIRWIFDGVSIPWSIAEVLIASFVICIMVRNVETWSPKFRERHSTPMPLVLLIALLTCVLCFLIDFLWNLWVVYDMNTGTWTELLASAKLLMHSNVSAYVLLTAVICIICGIYFICLKPYRVSGIVLIGIGFVFGIGGYIFANHLMSVMAHKQIHDLSFPRIKY